MPVLNESRKEVDANDVKGIDSNHLEAQNERLLFFIVFFCLLHEVAVGISNVELVLPVKQEPALLPWLFSVNNHDIESQLVVFLIAGDVELVITEGHTLDLSQPVCGVVVVLLSLLNVDVEDVLF